jgi:sodium/pantothenate symporter
MERGAPVPDPLSPLLLGAGESGATNSALISFSIYLAGVFFIAWLSARVLKGKEFLSEYFLGSRNLGMWAFALTFAATNASGGSFMGFPSLIYTHGWVLALWIGSYMIVPLVTMGLLAKRLNQVARNAGAITVPEVLRERFDSKRLGMLATLLLTFLCFSICWRSSRPVATS